jgi:hypothetical protein
MIMNDHQERLKKIGQLRAKQAELNEELYDSKITTPRVLLAAVGFVILSAVLIMVVAIVWPAALLISAFSVAFFSQIAHAVGNRINSFITGVKLDRIEKQLTELGSQAKSQSANLPSVPENIDSAEKRLKDPRIPKGHKGGSFFPILKVIEEEPADLVNVASYNK